MIQLDKLPDLTLCAAHIAARLACPLAFVNPCSPHGNASSPTLCRRVALQDSGIPPYRMSPLQLLPRRRSTCPRLSLRLTFPYLHPSLWAAARRLTTPSLLTSGVVALLGPQHALRQLLPPSSIGDELGVMPSPCIVLSVAPSTWEETDL